MSWKQLPFLKESSISMNPEQKNGEDEGEIASSYSLLK